MLVTYITQIFSQFINFQGQEILATQASIRACQSIVSYFSALFLSLFGLLCILSGDIELNHMITCDSYSCWSHNSCVKIVLSVADKYPFVHPFCLKSSVLSISLFFQKFPGLVWLNYKRLSSSPLFLNRIKYSGQFFGFLSTKVQSTFHSLLPFIHYL